MHSSTETSPVPPADDRAGGWTADGFESVRAAFEAGQRGDPGAAQLAVYQDGDLVVDLWAGRDPVRGRQPDGDSLSVVMSVSKGVVATAAHLLAQRGQLDLDAPVADYWPEFAARGKDRVTVSDLLAHRAGLHAFPPEAAVDLARLCDWDYCTGVLAAAAPLWQPGTAYHYHALTYGYLVGEVIRRAAGRSVGEFLATDIAAPLRLDVWIGLPEAHESRVLDQFSTRPAADPAQVAAVLAKFGADPDDPVVRASVASIGAIGRATDDFNSRAVHAAQIPAANAIASARSLARLYAAVTGPVDGTRLLTEDTVSRATAPQTDQLPAPSPLDRIPGINQSRHGLGYELASPSVPMLGDGSFGHAGAGGRLSFAQPRTGTAVAFTCTNMAWDPMAGPDPRWLPWTVALRGRLGLD
jgi:CubicO group peptidase (beta-lactamase class C family)